jgi:hypothetical protein
VSVKAVVFDVGETLVDETEAWGDWADWLGVPRLTFFATLGSVIARGGDHREVFPILRPGIDLAAESRARQAAGRRAAVTIDDFYPDALVCLRRSSRRASSSGLPGTSRPRRSQSSRASTFRWRSSRRRSAGASTSRTRRSSRRS